MPSFEQAHAAVIYLFGDHENSYLAPSYECRSEKKLDAFVIVLEAGRQRHDLLCHRALELSEMTQRGLGLL